jgi:hypothetical protein
MTNGPGPRKAGQDGASGGPAAPGLCPGGRLV